MIIDNSPDSKVHWANMGPTMALLAPDGPHVGPMNIAIREDYITPQIVAWALGLISLNK